MTLSLSRGVSVLLVVLGLSVHPAVAEKAIIDDDDTLDNVAGAGGGGHNSDPPSRARPSSAQTRGKSPTLSVTSTIWFGFRHKFSKDFLVDFYSKQKSGIRELPYQTPTTEAAGGLSAAWAIGGFTLSGAFESKQSYKGNYGTWNGSGYDLRSAIARQIPLWENWSITTSFLTSHLWSSSRTRDRWKVELAAPLNYQLGNGWTLQPLIPSVALAAYTHRRTGQRDWTFDIGTGVRYQVNPVTVLAMSVGFEQRLSNVATAEYSRWVLQPKVQVRVDF
jgi:hypothetical protein